MRDPICGLFLPSIFPSKGDKEADESSLTAPVKAMIVFILKSFPDAQKSPYHPSSRSFAELQMLRFPRDRFWPSALRIRCLSLTLNRDSLIALRMDGYALLCCLLSTSSRRPPIRLLKEVLKINPNIFNLFCNKIPNISHVRMSLKETVTVEQSLASDLESHNFLT